MAGYAVSALLTLASATYVLAQTPTIEPTPLASLHFNSPADLPYQVEPNPVLRGSQFGYNICNSTTQNQQSLCQTMYVNHLDDFCLWAPDKPNSTIADTEGEEVAWCTSNKYGTRQIPAGALQGVQLLTAPDYTLISGFIDQTQVNIQDGDEGGELDPHGQDLAGNPMGGIVFSNALSGSNTTYLQVPEWNLFIGSGTFCLKICPDSGPAKNSAGFCRNTLDRLGCFYNSPANPVKGTFEACDSANMDLPGVYVVNGQTLTYTQPAETVPIGALPYTPTVPASSNCTPFASTDLYAALASVTGAPQGSSTPAPSSSAGSTSSGALSSAPSSTGSGASTNKFSSSSAAKPTTTPVNGASAFGGSLAASIVGVVFSVAFLA